MTIRNVNGRNVYVLEPQPVTGTYSNGQSIATLYSDLRWKVWEEIQKSQMAQLQVETLSAKARADIYEQSQRDLRRAITNLQELRAEAIAGGSSANQIARTMRDQARLDLEAQKANVRRDISMQTIVTDAPVDPMLQIAGLLPPDAKATTTRRRVGEVREVEAPQIAEQEGGTAPVSAPAGTEGREGLDFLDQEIERLEGELRSEQEAYMQGLRGTDFDLLNRTRRAYESEVGVIGQGGGAFGLAPRPRRYLPRVDQPVAQERIDQFVAGRTDYLDAAEREAADKRSATEARLNRTLALARDLDAIGLGGEGGEADMLFRDAEQIQRELTLLPTPEQARQKAADDLRERYINAEGFRYRQAGDLLLRDRDTPSRDGEPRVPRDRTGQLPPATVTAGEMEIVREPEVIPQQPVTAPPSPPERDTFFTPALMTDEERRAAAPPPMGEKPEGEIGVYEEPEPIERLPPYGEVVGGGAEIEGDRNRLSGAFPQPADIVPRIEPPTRTTPIALGEEEAIVNPEMLRGGRGYTYTDELLQQAIDHYTGTTIQRSGERMQTIKNPVRFWGGETETVIQYLQDKRRELAPVGIDISEDLETIREEEPALRERFNRERGQRREKRSSRQRKDAYKMNVVSEGTKLASQPKRLQRIAKIDAETEDRPQHLVIVDRLYETNKGKANAFKMTYDEISRAFAENPSERQEAHTYLVAKDILESNIQEPLA